MESNQKANYAESAIRKLKQKLQQISTYTGRRDWAQFYKGALETLNTTAHSRTKLAPLSVERDPKLAGKVFEKRFGKFVKNPWYHIGLPQGKQERFPKGSKVRITKIRRAFSKGTAPQFSSEVFTVERVRETQPLETYVLTDLAGEKVTSFFYPFELQLAEANWEKHRRVEKIYKRRDESIQVSWKDHPQSEDYRSWIPKAALSEYREPIA